MSVEVKVPAVGESITSGLISTWHKKDGEQVNAGDVLLTLETDKVSTEITAEQAGVLKIKAKEGTEVKIGEVIATIEDSSGGPPAKTEAAPEQKKTAPSPPAAGVLPPKPSGRIETPPVASKAEQRKDVHEEPAEQAAPVESTNESRFTRKRLSPLRRKIAAQLVMAQQTAAILTTFNECDMTAVQDLRTRMQEGFQKEHGVKLGFMSIFIKATIAALRAVPSINARMDGDDLIENHYFDIGVAVGTERGLVVPVIRNADQKDFAQIEKDLGEYAAKAREGKIKIEDLQGGVFTISNGGVYGSLLSTPILNPPQSGILGLHKIQQRPIAVNGQVAIRPMMYLALSYDHRVVDGKEAVTFLVKVKECIEEPMRLLVG
ncbi:MAG: dihydrolipoyllysine-residue succinyltransferase [Verrucomicrobiota bacterium]|nr:dihydrolipoyllysine-residue succinyltransferase [Verrucomicrobiota bacterium]